MSYCQGKTFCRVCEQLFLETWKLGFYLVQEKGQGLVGWGGGGTFPLSGHGLHPSFVPELWDLRDRTSLL